MEVLRARYVFPVDRPPLRDAAVAIDDGRIVELIEAPAQAWDLGDVALLPGLVNAHTHLEFSRLTQPLPIEPGRFAAWIEQVIRWRIAQSAASGAATDWRAAAVRQGLRESLATGTTTLGEIATIPWSYAPYEGDAPPQDDSRLQRDSPLERPSGVAFLELLGLRDERHELLLAAAREFVAASRATGGSWQPGLSPHAPYTVAPALLTRIVRLSAEHRVPVAMHLAESADEIELLRTGRGPMRELLERVGAWQDGIFGDKTTLSAYLHQLQSAHRSLVIHGNFLTRDEIDLLGQQRQRMSVVYCPRTHAACGQPPYPLAAMLSAGVRVALGTDSRATNPDLSLLRELRFAAARHPETHPGELLRAATLSAAEALGLDEEIGSLTPGKRADLIAVPIETAARAKPHQALMAGDQPVAAVLKAGQVVFTADNWRSVFAESLAPRSLQDGPSRR